MFFQGNASAESGGKEGRGGLEGLSQTLCKEEGEFLVKLVGHRRLRPPPVSFAVTSGNGGEKKKGARFGLAPHVEETCSLCECLYVRYA